VKDTVTVAAVENGDTQHTSSSVMASTLRSENRVAAVGSASV